MPADVVLTEHPVPNVTLLRVNRPEAKNALNSEVRKQLITSLEAADEDESVRCVILAGSGGSFVAGADIREMAGLGTIDMLLAQSDRLWQALRAFSKPLISAVRGYALGGGCELAMHSDIIVASDSAKFGQPEVRIGIIPGGGGTQRLTRAVGKYKAFRLLLTGQLISGTEAHEMGLVSELAEDNAVEARAFELAEQIARMPPLAIKQLKEVVLAGENAPLDTALQLERKALLILFASEDRQEGMNAFLEKRKPKFVGK